MNFTLNNTHLNDALELGSAKNVKQLFLAESENGSLEMRGDLDKRIAVKHLQDIINMEDALKGDWLERSSQSYPLPPTNIKKIVCCILFLAINHTNANNYNC